MRHSMPVMFGLLTLTACGGGSQVSPPPPPPPAVVASVSLARDTATLVPLQTLQLVATTKDGSGNVLTGQTIAWSSNATAIATVDANGLVTGVAAGTASVTALSAGKSAAATLTVRDGALIGAAGGQTSGAAGNVTVTVPAQALATSVAISITPVANPPSDPNLIPGTVYDLGPTGTQFAQLVTLTIRYDAAQVGLHAPAQFRIHKWSGTAWIPLAGGSVDVATRIVTGQTAGFSMYGVLELPASLPAITMLLPSAMVSGSPAFLLSVMGTSFVAGSQVQWNGSPRTTTFVSATQLTALVTATDIASNGTAQITVVNPGVAGTSPPRAYTIDTPPQISVGRGDACGFKADAQTYCWGTTFLITGIGATTVLTTPTAVSAGRMFRQISAETDHVCGVTSSGAAYCWGDDVYGQLGDAGFQGFSAPPVLVAGGLTWSQVAVGNVTTCGLTTAGVAYCWGQTNFITGAVNIAPAAVPSAPVFVSITVGANHECGVTPGGSAYCWGRRSGGALGDGIAGGGNQATPVAVSGNHSFTAISAGGAHTCGLEVGGAIWCWGAVETAAGSLGNGSGYGSSFGSLVPVLVAGGQLFQSVSAGLDHTCALDATGMAWCWGDGGHGVLGQGVANSSNVPVAVSGGLSFRSIAAGGPTCGVLTSGMVYCWGDRRALGNGSTGLSITPVPVSGGLSFSDIAISVHQTCGLTLAGTTSCWGTSRTGGDPTSTDESTPKLLAGVPAFVALSDQEGASICGRTAQGAVYCWGTTPTLFPAPVPLVSVNNSDGMTCGLSSSGALYCNGAVFEGGPTFTPQTPAFPGTSFSAVAIGNMFLCGILASGPTQCIGNGTAGQLGNGGFVGTTVLTNVSGGLPFASVASGGATTCAVTTGGAGYCWGVVPTNHEYLVPTLVVGNPAFTSIDVSLFGNFCGILAGNQPVCWGKYHPELLGTTAAMSSDAPLPVEGPAMRKVRIGFTHVCGLTPAGAAWCWGQQDVGELGNGMLGYVPTPTLVTW